MSTHAKSIYLHLSSFVEATTLVFFFLFSFFFLPFAPFAVAPIPAVGRSWGISTKGTSTTEVYRLQESWKQSCDHAKLGIMKQSNNLVRWTSLVFFGACGGD